MWDGFNKRKFPRLSVRCDVFLNLKGPSSAISTVTENLGVGGVCVVLDDAFERFEPCKVRLTLEDQKKPI